MDKEALHRVIDEMSLNWGSKATIHALIDLGRVTDFDCKAERCILPSRAINMGAVTTHAARPRDALQIDHVIPRAAGGNDRPENLRLTHYVCNVARAFHGKKRDTGPKNGRARRLAGAVPTSCDDCGRVFKGPHGLFQHRRQTCGRILVVPVDTQSVPQIE